MLLASWQKQLMHMAQGAASQKVSPSIVATNHMQQRLDAYQNNYSGGLIDALKIAYPQVLSLVGEAFFRQLANDYTAQQPMNKDNHQQYGAHLSQHIAQLAIHNQTFENVPYLADVAKSDWALYVSYYAAKRTAFDFIGFSQLDTEAQQTATLHLADDVHVISSQWPLSQLWQFHQKSTQNIELEEPNAEQRFIVHRLDNKPKIEPLSEHQHQVLQAIIYGHVIAALPESSAESLPEFIAKGWITGYQTK